MQIITHILDMPFVRRLGGAAVGVMAALLLYGVYQAGSAVVANLLPASSPVAITSQGPVDPVAAARVGADARMILATLEGQ